MAPLILNITSQSKPTRNLWHWDLILPVSVSNKYLNTSLYKWNQIISKLAGMTVIICQIGAGIIECSKEQQQINSRSLTLKSLILKLDRNPFLVLFSSTKNILNDRGRIFQAVVLVLGRSIHIDLEKLFILHKHSSGHILFLNLLHICF